MNDDELRAISQPNFVRESHLPRGYFDEKWYERIPRLPDGWVALIVVALLVAGILITRYAQ